MTQSFNDGSFQGLWYRTDMNYFVSDISIISPASFLFLLLSSELFLSIRQRLFCEESLYPLLSVSRGGNPNRQSWWSSYWLTHAISALLLSLLSKDNTSSFPSLGHLNLITLKHRFLMNLFLPTIHRFFWDFWLRLLSLVFPADMVLPSLLSP